MVSFSQVSLTKLCMHHSTHPYVSHAPPITFFLILLNSHKFFERYLNTRYKVMSIGRYTG